MRIFLNCFAAAFLCFNTYIQAEPTEKEHLVTVHGFLGHNFNMYYQGNQVENENISVKYWQYPTRDKRIEEHGADLANYLNNLALETPGKPIHFVTHSMGGLVLRSAINHPLCPLEAKIGKAILLAPPNQGAAWGRFLHQFVIPTSIAGKKSGLELLTEENFEYLGQFPETKEVMVIAGNFSLNPFLEGESDSTVKVEETYLNTPHEHYIIHATHQTILFSKEASQLINAFLQAEK